MSTSEEEFLDWDRKSRISLPAKAVDEYMLVPIREFRRLRQRIDKELSPRHDSLPAAYFALFGAALATGVAIPPLWTSRGLPSWIIPTFIVSAGAFLVLGIALVLVSRTLSKGRASAAAEIGRDMRDLEETYRGKRSTDPFAQHSTRNTLENP